MLADALAAQTATGRRQLNIQAPDFCLISEDN